jgi:hypothetical protein
VTTPQQYQAPSADDFLMGGGGAPSAKFPSPGTAVSGPITQRPTVEQQRDIQTGEKKFWQDGNPMMQLVVTVQTNERDPQVNDDDGRRRLFVKGQMKQAVADAVRAAGAAGLEVGGVLTVTYTHDGQPKQRGFSAPKQYRAEYIPAAAVQLQAPEPGQLQQGQPYPPAPAQQYAPPAPQGVPAGLTPQQHAAAQQNPHTAALLGQQQAAPAPTVGGEPPF